MRMWSWKWRWLGLVLVALALAWILFNRLQAWRSHGQLRIACLEIARGHLDAARQRLSPLARQSGDLGKAANYWLGVCESLGGRSEAALLAFARLPADYPFDGYGAYQAAKANMAQGRLHPAESYLEKAMARGGRDLEGVRDLLSEIYQIEVRFADVKTLLRGRLGQIADPLRTVRALNDLDLDRLPYDGLRGALLKAGQLAPHDERVWLGKGRLAIEAGRWDEAADWLARCQADSPVLKAWIEWAQRCGRPDKALDAARQLGPGKLEIEERFALRAWLHAQHGDSRAECATLEQWLRFEPAATRALERLAELARRAGQSERVGELRRRKAEVERALEAYRSLLARDQPFHKAAERAKIAQAAEAAGRRPEARALYAWALAAEPSFQPAQDALVRLDKLNAELRRAEITDDEPWPDYKPPPGSSITTRSDRTRSEPLGPLSFNDDAEAAGLRFVYDNAETPFHQLPEPFGGGLALLDYDGDGWLDVYCVQGGSFTPAREPLSSASVSGDRLFHNRGNGRFDDVTETAGIGRLPRGHGHGVAVGDIDGDGRPDLFITRWRSYALLRNKGDGAFEDITQTAGLGGDRDWPTSAAFADLDGDGDLDLYVCHYAAWDLENPRLCRNNANNQYLNCPPLGSAALPDHLFRNDSGHFVDVTTEAGIVDRNGRGLGVVAADLDDDGRVDLFVANDSSANFLFHNKGGMRFEEAGHAAGVAGNASGGYQAGMGVASGDLDGDGEIDLAVTNFYGESTTYYRNLGEGNFIDATAAVGLVVASRRFLGFGVALFDADNDGRLDLASANGHVNDLRPNYPYRMPALLLVSDPDGRLIDASDRAGAPWKVPRMGRGLAVGDLDNDGRIDVLIQSHNQPLAYLHNQTTNGGRFLVLHLEGSQSNRDAVGAKVAVIAGGTRLIAQRVGGGSYQSASDPRLHFGLGQISRIETIEVTWPSGRVDRYRDLKVDSGFAVREGDAKPRPLAGYSTITPRP